MNEIEIKNLLKNNNLKITNTRLEVSKYLWSDSKNKHVTADMIYKYLILKDLNITQATVYNILNDFIQCGLLSEISIENQPKFFDTNLNEHNHYYHINELRLEDISKEKIEIPPNKKLIKKTLIYYLEDK